MPIALLRNRIFKTLWAEDYGLARGSGTPYVPEPPAADGPLIVDGAVLLQSDDGTWHWLTLATEGGIVTTDVDQDAVAAPGGTYLAYLPLAGGDGNTYRVALGSDGEFGIVSVSVDQTPRVEAGAAAQNLKSDDALTYPFSLDVIEDGLVTWAVGQTPV